MKNHLVAVSALLLLAGCGEKTFSRSTPPPPDRVAGLSDKDGDIRLSRGIAIGVECVDEYNRPCKSKEVGTDDASIAEVSVVASEELIPLWAGTTQARSEFVVTGIGEGSTTVTISGEEFDITVIAP